MIFLDASVLLAAEDSDDPNQASAVALLRTGALGTLDLAAYELTNVAETRWRDPQAGERLRQRIWAIAELGALIRVDQALAERAAALSRQHAISAYEAAYVAGAERLGAPLASCDERDLVSRGLAKLPRDLLTSQPGAAQGGGPLSGALVQQIEDPAEVLDRQEPTGVIATWRWSKPVAQRRNRGPCGPRFVAVRR